MGDLVIPARLRSTSVRWEGDRARAWLEELPGIVTAVTEAWDLEVAGPYEPGGNISWVAPCTRRGEAAPLVLKVQLPHPESDPEASALAAWQGRSAVRLHAHDAARHALLLERCEPGDVLREIDDVGAGLDAATAIAVDLHAVAPPSGVPALADVYGGWADTLESHRAQLPQMDEGLRDLALATMRSSGGASGREVVLLHGDLNPTNILASARGWLAIDPKPMVGDPACDAARVILQLPPTEGPDPIAAVGARIRRVAAALGVASEAIASWCLVDLVEMSGFAAINGSIEESRRLVAMLDWVVPSLG